MLINELDQNTPKKAYATRAQSQHLANELKRDFPQADIKVEKKGISPVHYLRILRSDINQITDFFKNRVGLDSLPLTQEQLAVTGKYQKSMLSYLADGIVYTLVVASSGRSPTDDANKINVSIKELTPAALGIAGKKYNRPQLIAAVKNAVQTKFVNRPDLQQVLLSLLEVAIGNISALPPELNDKLSARSRAQIGVDFGEVLAPIMLMDANDTAEFPSEANAKLIDVYVGDRGYSVKSLTGSGTSFASIVDLMDRYENSIIDDEEKQQLFKLFKAFHPSSGGLNVDKLIRGAKFINTPEYQKLLEILGVKDIDSYSDLKNKVEGFIGSGNDVMEYGDFLKSFYSMMTAGNWDKPTGLPADGAYYMGLKKEKPVSKTAGYPSYTAKPAKGAADIITYALGVGLLNAVTQGPDNKKYSDMMTNIVTKSPTYLGKIDLNDQGGLEITAKPFSELQFKFQYHAPSHIPGNNLPGFMIVY